MKHEILFFEFTPTVRNGFWTEDAVIELKLALLRVLLLFLVLL